MESDNLVASQAPEDAYPAIPPAPRLAYLLSGTKGDGQRMRRVLQAVYHPRNQYLLHLDLEAPTKERVDLARYVRLDPTFVAADNVHVVGKANLVTYRGPTMIAATLHAAAILLKQSRDWDWFINLSASDYPLMTQDGPCSSPLQIFACLLSHGDVKIVSVSISQFVACRLWL